MAQTEAVSHHAVLKNVVEMSTAEMGMGEEGVGDNLSTGKVAAEINLVVSSILPRNVLWRISLYMNRINLVPRQLLGTVLCRTR